MSLSDSSQQQAPLSSSRTACPIRYALIDLSGTLHIKDRPIPGAVEAVRKLLNSCNSSGCMLRRVLFLTNTTTVAASTLHRQLVSMGFPPEMKIMTSADAVREYIKQQNLNPFCIVEEDLLQTDLSEFTSIAETDFDSVLVGLSPSKFHYDALNKAFRILHRHKPNDTKRLIAFHTSKYIRDDDGELSLGPGGFVKCLEHTTGHVPHVLGKPSVGFYHAAVAKLSNEDDDDNSNNSNSNNPVNHLHQCIMVGDDYLNDVMGALDAGMGQGILVQTGKYQLGDEQQLGQYRGRGVAVVPSIVEAVEFILDSARSDNS